MEFRREKIWPAALLTASLVLGNVACSNEDASSHSSQTEQTNESGDFEENANQAHEYSFDEILSSIGSVEFFATPLEYAALPPGYNLAPEDRDTDARTLLANRGIDVTNNRSTPHYGRYGIVTDSVAMLALLPCRLVEASGLQHIVFFEPPEFRSIEARSEKDNSYAKEPRINRGVAEVDNQAELSRAVAALILENVPSAKDVVREFEEITNAAGAAYNPDFNIRYRYDEEGYFIPNPDFPEEYYSIFQSQESIISARVEFINMFSNFVYGVATDYIDKPDTPNGQKKALLVELYATIAGDNGATLRFQRLAHHYGTHNLHPLDNVTRIKALQQDLSKAQTGEQRAEIIVNDDSELLLYDPKYPPNLEIAKKPRPESCKANSTNSIA